MAKQIRKSLEIPELSMRAQFSPETVDKEARTAELVWTTGSRVLRVPWFDEPYEEELSLDKEHVRLGRLNTGAPLLNTHQKSTLSDVVGVVEKAWLTPTEGRAVIRFSERADVDPIWKDVSTGIIRNISVGYRVYKMEDVTPSTAAKDQVRVMRAVDWEPLEISLVPIGADEGAGIRSHGADKNTCEIILGADSGQEKMEAKEMENDQNTKAADPVVARKEESAPVDVAAVKREAIESERKRVSEISQLVRTAKLDDKFAQELISGGKSLEESRDLVLAKWHEAQSKVDTRSHHKVSIGQDETVTLREGIVESLLHRFDSKKFPITDKSREFQGSSLLDLARFLLERSGENTRGMQKQTIAERSMLSGSDFPSILLAVSNKTLRDSYEAAPQTFRPIVREVQANDFKTMYRVQIGDAPSLEPVNEQGEFKRGAPGDSKESYQIATYGKIISVTRQVIINDDLAALTRLPNMFGRAAADLESDTVWAILTGNPNMGDGNALFHASHNNLASAAGISVSALGAMRTLMRKQAGLNGRLLNIQGKYLIVPAALETVAQQFVSRDFVSTKSSDINPFAGQLQVITEPRLDAASASNYYLAADPGQIDVIEIAYLQGQNGVYLESKMGFDIDGMEFKARLDFGAKALDWRGLVKNPV